MSAQRSILSRACARLWRTWPGAPVPYRASWGVWLVLRADGTGLSLLRGEYPETRELHWLRKFLKPGMTVMDVGANQGIYTTAAARAVGRSGRVYAFEPAPSELKKLRSNIRVNRLRNVTVIESAVGNETGSITFHAAGPQKGGFSGLKKPSSYMNISTSEIAVQVTSLDEFTAEHNVESVDFLKVDVEGAEMMLIAGADKLLTRMPRPVAQFELADGRCQEYGYAASDIRKNLEGRGFTWLEFAEDGIRPHQPRESYSYLNLIGVPEERLHEVKPLQAL